MAKRKNSRNPYYKKILRKHGIQFERTVDEFGRRVWVSGDTQYESLRQLFIRKIILDRVDQDKYLLRRFNEHLKENSG